MKFIYLEGNSLIDLLGRERALGVTSGDKRLGVGKITQLMQDPMHTFVEVTDESNKFITGFSLISKTKAEALLTEKFIPKYIVKNEGLMNANINLLVSNGTLDLTEFDGVWDEQHELEELYEVHNVSGIKRSEKPIL